MKPITQEQFGRAAVADLPRPRADDLPPSCRAIFWLIVLTLGFFQAWNARFKMISDGVSYLGVGDAYFRGDWKAAINAHWSPLYSWLISFPRHLLGIPLSWESRWVHFENLLILIFVLISFEYLLTALIARRVAGEQARDTMPLHGSAIRLIAYALFLYSLSHWLTPAMVSPDLCVEGLVFFVTGMIVRIHAGDTRKTRFAAVGALLGIGYLTKGVMFPLAFAFLVATFLATSRTKRAFLRTLLACAVFLGVSAPFVTAVSWKTGVLTFGKTAQLNYLWMIDHLPQFGWQQQSPRAGTPVHPMREILASPPTYEFADSTLGTYPPWYDPYHWFEGATPYLNWAGQWESLKMGGKDFYQLFMAQCDFIVGLFVLFFAAPSFKSCLLNVRGQAYLWLPPVAAVALYAPIHVETRYLAGFLIVLWISLFLSVATSLQRVSQKFVWAVALALALTVAIHLTSVFAREGEGLRGATNEYGQVADQLRRMGVHSGDHVAVIGEGSNAYWARLVEVQIVAVTPVEEKPFDMLGIAWLSEPETRAKLYDAFRVSGARAIVGTIDGEYGWPSDWKRVGHSSFYVHNLNESSPIPLP